MGNEGMSLKSARASVGPGWQKLVDRFYGAKPRSVIVSDVKEKFGGLDISFSAYSFGKYRALEELVSRLRAESLKTCEYCGEPGSPRSLDGWVKTICQTCFEKGDKRVRET